MERVHLLLRRLLGKPIHTSQAQKHGILGEQKAYRFVRKELKYKVLQRNWRSGRGEIDLIARDGQTLIFIEVKARKANAKVPGFHAVNHPKKAILEQTARAYIRTLRHKPKHIRFDIIELKLEKSGLDRINHYKNSELFSKAFCA